MSLQWWRYRGIFYLITLVTVVLGLACGPIIGSSFEQKNYDEMYRYILYVLALAAIATYATRKLGDTS